MGIRNQLEKWAKGFQKRIANILLKGILDGIDYTTDFHVCKVILQEDELQNKVERIQPYGFTSFPEDGAQVLVGCINGDRNQSIVLTVGDSRYTVTGVGGDVVLHSKGDNEVRLNADGTIDIKTDGNAAINIGNNSVKKLVNEYFKTVFEEHRHNITVAVGGGAYYTSVPVKLTGTVPVVDVGNLGTLAFLSDIGTAQLTSKVMAE